MAWRLATRPRLGFGGVQNWKIGGLPGVQTTRKEISRAWTVEGQSAPMRKGLRTGGRSVDWGWGCLNAEMGTYEGDPGDPGGEISPPISITCPLGPSPWL